LLYIDVASALGTLVLPAAVLVAAVTGAFSLTMWVIPLVQFALLVWLFAPSPVGV